MLNILDSSLLQREISKYFPLEIDNGHYSVFITVKKILPHEDIDKIYNLISSGNEAVAKQFIHERGAAYLIMAFESLFPDDKDSVLAQAYFKHNADLNPPILFACLDLVFFSPNIY